MTWNRLSGRRIYPRWRRRCHSSTMPRLGLRRRILWISFNSVSVYWLGWLWGRLDWQIRVPHSHPSGLSRNRYMTDSYCTSGWHGWRRISPCILSGIADMLSPVLYSCSWRIWPPLVTLLSTTSTMTDEALSSILFYSTVQHIYCTPTLERKATWKNWLKIKQRMVWYIIIFLFIEEDYYNLKKHVDQKIADIYCCVSLDDGNNNKSLNTWKQET